MKNKGNTHDENGGKRMAILTAQCDQPFVVDSDKIKDFRAKKRNTKVFKEIEVLTAKISKNIKFEIDEK